MNWMAETTSEQLRQAISGLGRVIVEFDNTGVELWDGEFTCPNCGSKWRALVRIFKAKGRVICPQCNVTHEVDLLQEAA